jgi:kynurenine formamidase
MKIIDLSQEIFSGMPVFFDHPKVKIKPAVTHEQREGIQNPTTVSPVVHEITFGEHTGTHVDAINHFGRIYFEKSIDKMPLETFFTEAICLDFSNKRPLELINVDEIIEELEREGKEIREGDTVLFYTGHYRRFYGTDQWNNGPGIAPDVVRLLGDRGVAAFGVETMSPGVIGKGNKEIHTICGELGIPHYENVINLHLLIPYSRFRFIAFPLKIRGGTGSPVRAVALVEN